jgi:hypothetical protein
LEAEGASRFAVLVEDLVDRDDLDDLEALTDFVDECLDRWTSFVALEDVFLDLFGPATPVAATRTVRAIASMRVVMLPLLKGVPLESGNSKMIPEVK